MAAFFEKDPDAKADLRADNAGLGDRIDSKIKEYSKEGETTAPHRPDPHDLAEARDPRRGHRGPRCDARAAPSAGWSRMWAGGPGARRSSRATTSSRSTSFATGSAPSTKDTYFKSARPQNSRRDTEYGTSRKRSWGRCGMPGELRNIIVKELQDIFRDPRLFLGLVLMPVRMLPLMGAGNRSRRKRRRSSPPPWKSAS